MREPNRHSRADIRRWIVLFSLVVAGSSVSAQVDQRVVARQLLSTNETTRGRGISGALGVPPGQRGTELRAALVTALSRAGAENAQRLRDVARGRSVGPFDEGAFFGLIQAVAELQDRSAIPALTGVLGTGFLVINALADHGEQAIPAIASVVMADSIHYDAVKHGLIALRFIVEDVRFQPLSQNARNTLIRVARYRLDTPAEPAYLQDKISMWYAMDLAFALGEPALRLTIDSLSRNAAALATRGITEAEAVARIQQRAAQRLRGVAPLPVRKR